MNKYISLAASAALVLSLVGCNSDGVDGAAGPAGPQGPKGEKGDKGDKGDSANAANKVISSIRFAPLAFSANDTEKQIMRISPKMTVTYNDNTTQDFPLSWKTFAKMGDKIGSGTIGLMTDKDGNALTKSDGSQDISDGPDGNSLINVGGKSYIITHMEERPGSLYHTEVKVENNELKALNTAPVDLKSIGGTIINCASTKTSYGSHLGG